MTSGAFPAVRSRNPSRSSPRSRASFPARGEPLRPPGERPTSQGSLGTLAQASAVTPDSASRDSPPPCSDGEVNEDCSQRDKPTMWAKAGTLLREAHLSAT
jgi:hypothetical protein